MSKTNLLLTLILIMISTACCVGHLKDDPSQPAISANSMTAELIACGKRSLGLATCGARLGDEVELKVQGIYQGEMRAVSTGCNFDRTQSYSLNELVSFKFPLINKRCLVTVTLFPDYPPKWRKDVVVYGLRGIAAFRALEGSGFYSHSTQTGATTIHQDLNIPVKARDQVQVVLGGCGTPVEQKIYPVLEGVVSIPLNRYVDFSSRSSCVLDGFILSNSDDITFLGLYTKFASDFTPLPIPVVVTDVDKGVVSVRAITSVSIIALDHQVNVSSAVKFKKVNLSVSHTLRLYTSKGRSLIGEWNPQKGEWSWMN